MASKKCENCGKEIAEYFSACPFCSHKETKSSWGLKFFGAILLVIGITIMISSISGDTTTNNSYTTGIAITSDGVKKYHNNDFTIIESETKGTRSKDGTYTVKGKLKQNIDGSYTGLMLTLNLLDKDNNKVRETTGWISCEYLGNKIWEFEVYGNDADKVVTDYEIAYCYGY